MGTSLSIQAALEGSNTAFEAGWEEYFAGKVLPGAHQFYCGEEPMTTLTKRWDWLANFPMMEKWIGARKVKALRAYNQTITIDVPFVATLEFKRLLVKYGDNIGLIANAIKRWIAIQANSYDKDANTVYFSNSGAGPTGYDQVALFSTSHPHGPSGNQSNLSAGLNLSAPALDTVLTAMSGLRLENGEPAGINGNTLIVGPALKYRAISLIGASSDVRPIAIDNTGKEASASVVAATSSVNVYKGVLDLVVDMRRPASGTGAFYWEVIDSTQPKPLIRHLARAPEPHHQDQMDSPVRFNLDKFQWGVEGEWKTDAGFWPSAHRATGTA